MRQEGFGVAVKQRASPRRNVSSCDTTDREEEEGANSIQSDFNGHGKSRQREEPSQTEPPLNSQTEGRFDNRTKHSKVLY